MWGLRRFTGVFCENPVVVSSASELLLTLCCEHREGGCMDLEVCHKMREKQIRKYNNGKQVLKSIWVKNNYICKICIIKAKKKTSIRGFESAFIRRFMLILSKFNQLHNVTANGTGVVHWQSHFKNCQNLKICIKIINT